SGKKPEDKIMKAYQESIKYLECMMKKFITFCNENNLSRKDFNKRLNNLQTLIEEGEKAKTHIIVLINTRGTANAFINKLSEQEKTRINELESTLYYQKIISERDISNLQNEIKGLVLRERKYIDSLKRLGCIVIPRLVHTDSVGIPQEEITDLVGITQEEITDLV
ncbi:6927_t:CDS:2, partial [Scutellospora calospora]